MGNQPPPKTYVPRMEKLKLEIACMKVKGHLELQRDRRISQANGKEQQLIMMINSASRSMVDEKHKAASIVSDIAFIDACNIVIRCCDILKDRSMHICESRGNQEAVKELMPFVETIIWSKKQLNLDAMQEFASMMQCFFGAQGPTTLGLGANADPQLKKCFENVMPSDEEICIYLYKLSEKTGITVSHINLVGHRAGQKSPDQPPAQQVPLFLGQPAQSPYGVNVNGFQQQQGQVNIDIRVQEIPVRPQGGGGGYQQPPVGFPQQPVGYPQYPQNGFNQQGQFPVQQQQQQQPTYPQYSNIPQSTQNFPGINMPVFPIQNQQAYQAPNNVVKDITQQPPQQPYFQQQSQQPQYQQPQQPQYQPPQQPQQQQFQPPQQPQQQQSQQYFQQPSQQPQQQQQQPQQPQGQEQKGGDPSYQVADSLEERLRRIRDQS